MDEKDGKYDRKCRCGLEKCHFSWPMSEWFVEGGHGKARKSQERGQKTIVGRQNTERREDGKADETWEGVIGTVGKAKMKRQKAKMGSGGAGRGREAEGVREVARKDAKSQSRRGVVGPGET